MVDVVDEAARSRMMASIRGKDTAPEMTVRRFLHKKGFRYRLHDRSLPGSPDMVLPKYRLVIFVHGCFWHRHPGCHYSTVPDQNREKWQRKFDQNVKRDRRNIDQLLESGWRVMVIWECGLRTSESRIQLDSVPELILNTRISMIEWPLTERGPDRLSPDLDKGPQKIAPPTI
ncbi:very short patch repair endonuclease [Lacisediminimonas profundi]|uniref:very short patch repair endonuclease n=1 Tax=Lacisediminimonas profundi TaxID=2603856 RepID=UPI00124B070D|nr:DNA mismatch endonuclease Vsr [Lacisediminimonas profundi]